MIESLASFHIQPEKATYRFREPLIWTYLKNLMEIIIDMSSYHNLSTHMEFNIEIYKIG
jgi:hypothetical protein